MSLSKIDTEISQCRLCGETVEHFPNGNTVSIGANHDICILGEAPANNGWRKSGVAWYDVNHKLIPSGKILQKLLAEIDMTIEDTCFLEAVKCFPKDRKHLPDCCKNCKKFLFEQLREINPKIILSLGEAATRALGINFKKFYEVAGKEFNINGYAVIPVYHPSPASPVGYSKNVPIFKNIQKVH